MSITNNSDIIITKIGNYNVFLANWDILLVDYNDALPKIKFGINLMNLYIKKVKKKCTEVLQTERILEI